MDMLKEQEIVDELGLQPLIELLRDILSRGNSTSKEELRIVVSAGSLENTRKFSYTILNSAYSLNREILLIR